MSHATRYRGRIAPSPTGLLHIGHACTFWTAYQRSVQYGGVLVFRNEDLDPQRSRPEFVRAMYEDLRWLGISWHEGPDVGGPYAPYVQSERRDPYLKAWRLLRDNGFIYPCCCSRKDLAQAATAPHESDAPPDEEPIYPGWCRCRIDEARNYSAPAGVNWRFRIPDGESISFRDLRQGEQHYLAGRDFGDFVVWRRDDVPAYQLAVVVDDAGMRISEVVRGADLLKSTARQLLLIRALRLSVPVTIAICCATNMDSAWPSGTMRYRSAVCASRGLPPSRSWRAARNPKFICHPERAPGVGASRRTCISLDGE